MMFLRQGAHVVEQSDADRRRWERLPVAIPVFLRVANTDGSEVVEFATALNISAGGALVAVRRPFPDSSRVSIEIPSAPIPQSTGLPDSVRNLKARLVRVTHSERCHLLGLKFSRPLI
jgi:hypothetical protein